MLITKNKAKETMNITAIHKAHMELPYWKWSRESPQTTRLTTKRQLMKGS